MGVDLAHEAVSIPAERWQRWHKIARSIGNDDCVLAKELIPRQPGQICIGPPVLPAFSFCGQLATNKGWRTQSQSSWKAPAHRRDEPPQRL